MLIMIAFTACGNKATNKAEQDEKANETDRKSVV